jgi:trk system potassium uptake protein
MRRVLVVGGGRVGAAVTRLTAGTDAVTIVERDGSRCDELRTALPQADVRHGDGTDADDLERAGIRAQDVVVAVTDADAANALTCALARFEFGVPRTIARSVDPAHVWLLDDAVGVDVVLDQADLLARLITEEISLGEVATLVRLRRGAYSLVEERVPADAGAVGRPVAGLDLPGGAVVAVFRGDDVLPIGPELVVRAEDELLAVVPAGASELLARAIREP